ncbi:Gustatory and odorant receptor 24 [Frankliniella fusca]|uniref:Gustatory receptor n=1 Tax=Frankliniella fusca TaxID=407009 RepID=A0AAE1HSB8_9NEOP|nr:Gustatory and odorant receptor 24 [Frankliniella fusca]
MKWRWQRAPGGGGGGGGGRDKAAATGAPALFRQLRPLFVVLQLHGVLPVTLDGATGPVLRWRSPAAVLALAVWLGLVVVSVFIVDAQVRLLQRASALRMPFYEQVVQFMGTFAAVYLVMMPVVWYETRAPCAFLRSWRAVEADYAALCGRRLRVRVRVRCWLCVAGVMSITAPLSTGVLLLMREEVHRMMVLAQYNAFMVGVPMLWSCLCHALAQASAALAATLAEVPVDRAAVRAHAAIWNRLNEAIVALGSRWGKTISSFMMIVYVQWLVSAFTMMSVLLTGVGLNHILLMSAIAALSFFLIYLPCNGAQYAVDAVGCRSRDALLRLPTCRMDEKALEEVALLLDNIRSGSKDAVNVNGVVGLNRAFFVAFLKSSATYLVVLVQFATSTS